MKKTYESPSTEMVKTAMQQMVAVSTINLGRSYDGSSKIESRQDNTWDIWGNDDYEN